MILHPDEVICSKCGRLAWAGIIKEKKRSFFSSYSVSIITYHASQLDFKCKHQEERKVTFSEVNPLSYIRASFLFLLEDPHYKVIYKDCHVKPRSYFVYRDENGVELIRMESDILDYSNNLVGHHDPFYQFRHGNISLITNTIGSNKNQRFDIPIDMIKKYL